jgi:predicted Zn finger-like uncharacterized protein
MSLVTRCPKCHSDFVVKLEQLQALDGLVRCGACAHIFDGFATLESPLPTLTQRPGMEEPARSSLSAATMSTSATTASVPPIAEPAVLRHRAERSEPFEREEEHIPEPAVFFERADSEPSQKFSFSARAPDLAPDASGAILGESRLRGEGPSVGRTQPEFLVDEVDTPRLMMLLWSLASVLALGLLVIQLAYVYRNDIATQIPSLRPALDAMCAKLNCEVSLRRYLERISVSVIAFERHAAPEQESKAIDNMSLRFSLRNRLNQPQPWPALSLELTDASGTVVLRKRMSPNDYLPAALADKPFAANQEVSLLLPVTVTGLQINGYTLKPFFP